jgi:hypothetical protein
MATTQSMPAAPGVQMPAGLRPGDPKLAGTKPGEPRKEPAISAEMVAVAPGQALVPAATHEARMTFSAQVLRLPVELDISVQVRDFRVRDLLALALGQLIESQWGHGIDLPLAAGTVQLAWTEFEVVETRLAARITRVA